MSSFLRGLAAGHAVCFSSAILLVASRQKLRIPAPTVTATVNIHPATMLSSFR